LSAGGRPTKPTALKLLQGTARKGRLNPAEPKPETELPKPPAYLDAAGKREWYRCGAELEELGLVSQLDLHTYASYCSAVSFLAKCERKLGRLKPAQLVVVGASGYLQQHPIVAMTNAARKQVHELGSPFGLTPAARTKVTGKTKDKKQGRFAGLKKEA
jgi:P27 family predicted phage terminase small subunit